MENQSDLSKTQEPVVITRLLVPASNPDVIVTLPEPKTTEIQRLIASVSDCC